MKFISKIWESFIESISLQAEVSPHFNLTHYERSLLVENDYDSIGTGHCELKCQVWE